MHLQQCDHFLKEFIRKTHSSTVTKLETVSGNRLFCNFLEIWGQFDEIDCWSQTILKPMIIILYSFSSLFDLTYNSNVRRVLSRLEVYQIYFIWIHFLDRVISGINLLKKKNLYFKMSNLTVHYFLRVTLIKLISFAVINIKMTHQFLDQ